MRLCLILSLMLISSFSFAAKPHLSDGIYYAYWVYYAGSTEKLYPILANKPSKDAVGYFLAPIGIVSNEIYLSIQHGQPSFYYRQENYGGTVITMGWGNAKFENNAFRVPSKTIQAFFDPPFNPPESELKKFYVGTPFSGIDIWLENDEIIPYKVIGETAFSVSCQEYLKVNGYDIKGLPSFDIDHQAYNATIFATEPSICSIFLDDDDVVPEIKNGKILFKKID